MLMGGASRAALLPQARSPLWYNLPSTDKELSLRREEDLYLRQLAHIAHAHVAPPLGVARDPQQVGQDRAAISIEESVEEEDEDDELPDDDGIHNFGSEPEIDSGQDEGLASADMEGEFSFEAL